MTPYEIRKQKAKDLYWKRVRNRECTDCGKPLPDGETNKRHEECRMKRKLRDAGVKA